MDNNNKADQLIQELNLYPFTKADSARLQKDTWDENKNYFSWGIEEMNDAFPLLQEGHLVVMAGAQSSGKTTWSFQMALQNALVGKEKGFGVGYLSLEVPIESILKINAYRMEGVTKNDIRLHKLYEFEDIEEKKENVKQYYDSIADSGLLFYPSESSVDLRYLENIERILHSNTRPSILFIDNLNEVFDKSEVEYERQDKIVKTLKALASEYQTTIVLLHHLAKEKGNVEPDINSIKGNNIVNTKADTTVAIFKKEIPNPNWICPVDVDKKIKKQFYADAPMVTVRELWVWKDRWWANEGLQGYMNLNYAGGIEFTPTWNLKEKYPLHLEDQFKMKTLKELLNIE